MKKFLILTLALAGVALLSAGCSAFEQPKNATPDEVTKKQILQPADSGLDVFSLELSSGEFVDCIADNSERVQMQPSCNWGALKSTPASDRSPAARASEELGYDVFTFRLPSDELVECVASSTTHQRTPSCNWSEKKPYNPQEGYSTNLNLQVTTVAYAGTEIVCIGILPAKYRTAGADCDWASAQNR